MDRTDRRQARALFSCVLVAVVVGLGATASHGGFGPAQGVVNPGASTPTSSNLATVMMNAPNPGVTGATDLTVTSGQKITSAAASDLLLNAVTGQGVAIQINGSTQYRFLTGTGGLTGPSGSAFNLVAGAGQAITLTGAGNGTDSIVQNSGTGRVVLNSAGTGNISLQANGSERVTINSSGVLGTGLIYSTNSASFPAATSMSNSTWLSAFDAASGWRFVSSGTSTPPVVALMQSRGTIAAPTAVASGDAVGLFDGQGYIGPTITYSSMARITFAADGTPVDGGTPSAPGRIVFSTTPTGNNILSTRWAMLNGGDLRGASGLGFGWTASATDPTGALDTRIRRTAGAQVTVDDGAGGSGTLVATTLTGTLSTVAQPNVTSVGTLAGLTMTGTLSMSGTPVISGSPACTLGATTVTTLGMGGTLTVGANTLSLASSTVSGTPTWSSSQALTVSTAAQPNITSLGTLTALTATRTSNDGGDLLTLTKNPGNAQAGNVLNISAGANSTGTVIFVNQTTGGSGLLFDLQNNSVSKFKVSNAGTLTLVGNVIGSGAITAGNSSAIQWNGRAGMLSPADSRIQLSNNAGTSFASLEPIVNGTATLGIAAVGWKGIYLDYTNTGTVGNVTINKPSGRVNMAAAGTTFTVTNSLVTAASHIFLNSDGAPGNVVAVQFYAVPAAGSFTVNAVPAVTNQTAIDFLVINAD